MKKNNLLKILFVTFIFAVFLSWIIPVGEYENAVFKLGEITPTGIFDFALIPLTVFDLALPTIIFILVVGGFYGVLNKTGSYATMIQKFVSKLKGKEIRFLIVITVLFGLLSALVGLNIGFFFVIPLVTAILFKLGFSKITTMLSTIGSILIGMMGSIYSSDVSYYINKYFSNKSDYNYNTSIFPDRIILLILLLFLLTMFVLKLGKKDLKSNNKNEEIPLYIEKEKSKKSWVPLFIIIIISFVLMLIGTFKWDDILGSANNATPFLDFYKKMSEIKLGGISIITGILGTVPAFGYWKLPFLSVLVLFITIIISLIYRLSLDDIIESFGKGLKENLKLVLYIIGANLVFMLLFKNGVSANYVTTIVEYLMNLTENFNSIILSITTIISSFFYNSFSTLISTLYTPTVILTGTTVNLRFLAALIIQTMYGLVMLIAPTSVLLILGLSYFNISYKEWLKNSWKLLLQLLIVIIALIIIVTCFTM